MAWRRLLWTGLIVVGGCSWQDTLVDGEFTPEQWSHLQTQLALPQPPDSCELAGYGSDDTGKQQCIAAIDLASQMFMDPALSSNGSVSCTTCHDSMHGWIDSRPQANVSLGPTLWTKRNAMTLWNLGLKQKYAADQEIVLPFAWDGAYATSGAVVDRAVVKAMQSTHTQVACLVRPSPTCTKPSNGSYEMLYLELGNFSDSDDEVFAKVEQAFTAFLTGMPQFQTQPTPFDAYLAGNESAISDSAKRGFAVFAGRGGCIDCHNSYLFSDLLPHDTGVPQQGANVVAIDLGHGGVGSSPDHTYDGAFITGTLREIASTGPYMHDGAFATLADVIAFYRGGGVAGGYSGARDPRIQPLDLSDQDALDLEAFLQSLTQGPPPPGMGSGSGMPPVDAPVEPDAAACAVPGWQLCNGMCIDVESDVSNCGACGHMCLTDQCQQGMCI